MFNVICIGLSQATMILVDKKYDIDICLSLFKKHARYKGISYGGDSNLKTILNSSFNEDDWNILSKLYKSNVCYFNTHRSVDPNEYWYCESWDKEKQESFIIGLDKKEIDFLFDFWDNSNYKYSSTTQLAKGKITEIVNNKIIKDIIE